MLEGLQGSSLGYCKWHRRQVCKLKNSGFFKKDLKLFG
jgi:hypothetical protein